MNQTPALNADTVIASLRRIMPPRALIHVGVGRGTGAMHQWRDWTVPSAWLVDAEPEQLGWTGQLAAAHPEWQVHSALLADVDGQAPYYRASNPAESGLVATSKLAALWSNLREAEQSERTTMRLDNLLADANPAEDAGTWLIVDCLPALRILQGAPKTLERCSVLWLRALLQPLPEGEAGTTLEELQAFVEPLGFRCVQVIDGNHPAVGEAIFVRDWARRLQPVIGKLMAAQEASAKATTQANEAHAKLAADNQTQIGKLDAERAALATKLTSQEQAQTELANKFKALEKEHAAKLEALSAAQSEVSARAGERDAQSKLATERQAKLDALAKEKTELSAKLDALTKTHADLADKLATLDQQQSAKAEAVKEAQSALAARTGERDAQAKLATERQAKIDALAKEKTELAAKLDAQTKLASERQAQTEALAKEKAEVSDKLAAEAKRSTELTGKLAALEKDHAATAQTLKAAHADLATRTEERDAQAKLATERQTQIDALGKEKTAIADKLAAADSAKQDLAKRSEALQGQVEQLTKARDEQAKLASERAAQATQLSTQRDNASKENQTLKSDAQAKEAVIVKLNERIAEQDVRERQLVEEIVRAEAQIDLIKDLLLREGGL